MSRNVDDLLALVDARWRSELLRLIETGEADEAFLNYLDSNEAAQAAVDELFTARAAAVRDLVQSLEAETASPRQQASKPQARFVIEGSVALEVLNEIEKVVASLAKAEQAATGASQSGEIAVARRQVAAARQEAERAVSLLESAKRATPTAP